MRIQLHWQHTEQELHHAYRHAPNPQATRRLYALSLLRRSCTPTQVAHLMGVSRAMLYRWYHWYATEGLECLQTRPHGGARRQATSLTPAQQAALRDYAATHGFRTQAEAQAWVREQFGVVSAAGVAPQGAPSPCGTRRRGGTGGVEKRGGLRRR